MTRAVFLDRDGVLTRSVVRDGKPYAPSSLEEMDIVPDAAEAVTALRQAGFRVIVVTNQPDVGKGLLRREIVEVMHQRLRAALPLDDIKACYHVTKDACWCRKPKPGMLLQAAQEWAIELRGSIMVGDRWSDIAAGRAVGCKTILLQQDYLEQRAVAPDVEVQSLNEASRWILTHWME